MIWMMSQPLKMQQNLRKSLGFFTLGLIAVVGLPGCAVLSGTSSTPTTVASNSDQTEIPPIKTGGSSSTVNFLQTLTTAYTDTLETAEVDLLQPGQSENIIAGVVQGLIDVGTISRGYLKPEETDEALNFHATAQDAIVVATHPNVTGVSNLTTEELKGIYSGTITNWRQLGGPEANIQLLDRPEDESAKRLLRESYLGADLPNSPNAIVLREETELIQTLQSTPYSIGAFSLAYAISHNLPVNRLSLNGITPTPETLKIGQYPMARTIGLLWNKNASDSTTEFVNYIFSPQGAAVMEQSGFAPLPQPTDLK